MCEIFSLITAAVSVATTAATTAMGVISGIESSNNAKAQYNYQAELDKRNSIIAQNNADNLRQEGIEETRMKRIQTIQSIANQQVGMAANNIDVSTGTPLDIIEDTAAIGELEANTIRYKSEQNAQSYENQAYNYNQQASLDKINASNRDKQFIYNTTLAGMNSLNRTFGNSKRLNNKTSEYNPL